MPHVLLLAGTCGSGKTTIAALLGTRPGWTHLSEDEAWSRLFGKERSAFGSAEHRRKRHLVQQEIVRSIAAAFHAEHSVALDATVHESPPEAYEEYGELFQSRGMAWTLRVLHPALEVAVARDAGRAGRPLGELRVAQLRAKFTQQVFDAAWFVDTSAQTPEQTVALLVAAGVA